MALLRRRKTSPYDEEEDRVEFRTDLPMKLRFRWIELKHGFASLRLVRALRVRLDDLRRARAEERELRELGMGRGTRGR